MHGNQKFVPIAAMVLGAAMATATAAQPEDPYRACDALADPAKRLACYDEVRAGQRHGKPDSAETTTVTPTEQPGPGPAEPPPVESKTAPQTPEAETIRSPQTATLIPAEPAPSAEPASTPSTDNFGLKRGGIKSIEAVVARIETNYAKERTFYLTNGQVWREMWHDRTMVSENDTVKVARSLTGAYFLKVGRFSTRVERIE